MNNNYNNISFDYIGAIGTHTITDYIDELTSNTYHININNPNCLINTSNTIDFINGSLINVNNTYIYNNYQYGEIRFKIKDDDKYYIKIGRDGKLYLWITYNILRPEILQGWYEVSDILADYFFNLAIINGAITAYGAELVYLQEQVNVLDAGVGAIDLQIGGIIGTLQIHTQQINELIALQPESLVSSYLDDELLNPNDIVNNIIFNGVNSVSRLSTGIQSMISLGGLGLIGWIGVGTYNYFARLREEQQEKNLRLNNIYGTLLLNSNISNLDVPDINNPGKTLKEKLYSNIFSNMENTNNLEIFYTSNMITTLGFINCNIQTQQIIPNLKTSLLNLNSGNIVNVNNITSSGKIKENNIFLESTYATIDYVNTNLFNNSYTTERLYPSKTFNSYTLATTTNEILGRQSFKETITLTSDGITYGNGTYNIYSSSSYGNSDFNKRNLFNFTVNSAAFWESGNYNYETGFFNRNDMFLKNNYFGDWVVIKLLTPLILNHFKLYYTNIYSAPSLWRFYGSNDGLTFTEIPEGGNFIDPLNIDNYSGGFYEKIFSNVKEYIYLGIVINKIIGGNISASYLNFGKFELYGVNVNNYNNIYTTSNVVKSLVRNEMPDVPKRKVFIVSIPSSSTFFDATSTTTFYKWDLDLTKYTTTQLIASDPPTGDLLRNFKISFWYVPSYFGSYLNAEPYVVSYTVFMSNKSNPVFGKPETAGVNIYAVGFPENIKLNNILPNNLMLLKNYFGNFNYLTIVSRNAPADIYVVIEDQLF